MILLLLANEKYCCYATLEKTRVPTEPLVIETEGPEGPQGPPKPQFDARTSKFDAFIPEANTTIMGPLRPTATQPTDTPTKTSFTRWQREAIADFKTIESLIKENHPGILLQGHDDVYERFEQGRREFIERLPLVTSPASWFFSLQKYIAQFHDPHVALFGWGEFHETKKWPQFLAEFTGKRFVVTHSTNKAAPNGFIITHIDGFDAKTWIDCNIIPYLSTIPNTPAAYHQAAPLALIWKDNPFVTRPKTVSIRSKHDETTPSRTLQLTWTHLPHDAYLKHMSQLAQEPSWKERTLDPITIRNVAPGITWVKIPTFMYQAKGIAYRMFMRSAKRLARLQANKAIIFDLRGNGGGLLHLPGYILQFLFGGPATCDAICASRAGSLLIPSAATTHELLQNAGATPEIVDCVCEASLLNTATLVSMRYIAGEGMLPLTHPEPSNPITAKIYVITDGKAVSSALYFIDILKLLTNNNVILIGQPTLGDTSYTALKIYNLADGGRLALPTIVHLGRTRREREVYFPDFPLSATRMRDNAWLKKKVLDIIEGRIPRPKASASPQGPSGSQSELPMPRQRDDRE